MKRGTYVLASDAAEDQNLDQSNEGANRILVEDEELGIPSLGEHLVD